MWNIELCAETKVGRGKSDFFLHTTNVPLEAIKVLYEMAIMRKQLILGMYVPHNKQHTRCALLVVCLSPKQHQVSVNRIPTSRKIRRRVMQR